MILRLCSFSVLLTLSFFLMTGNAQSAVACEKKKVGQVESWRTQHPKGRVIFFASWCSQCVAHLKEYRPGEDLFVLAFDEQESGVRALSAVVGEIKVLCYWDYKNGIVDRYGVKSLPFILEAGREKQE